MQPACSNSIAIGLPTMLLRRRSPPRRAPFSGHLLRLQHFHHAIGRAGNEARVALHQGTPTFSALKPSPSFSGSDGFEHGSASELGSGNCTRMPCMTDRHSARRCAPT